MKACVVNEDTSHQLRRHAEKLRSVLPVSILLANEFHVGFVDKRRRLKGVIGALAARPEIARQLSQLDVSNLHDAVAILDGDPVLLRLGESDFVARLQQYLDLAPALRERLHSIDYVDLRFDERLYVRPARPAGAKQ